MRPKVVPTLAEWSVTPNRMPPSTLVEIIADADEMVARLQSVCGGELSIRGSGIVRTFAG